jgi:predicted HTH domain antitoxin
VNVTISIPDDLGAVLAGTAEQLEARVQADLAVQYYQQGLVSMGRAAEMSGLPRGEFERVLAERQVPRNYSVEDLRDDLAAVSLGSIR